ncbi:MAG: hypothetical protein KDA33_04200, partial [Phycisphaerales bacterium]|nr:hypothetical protein [Phycisphaerales bacterium]
MGLSILLLAAACDYERKPPVRASRRSIHIAVVGTWDEAPAWDVLRTVAGQIVSETPGAKVSFFAPENRTPAAQQA